MPKPDISFLFFFKKSEYVLNNFHLVTIEISIGDSLNLLKSASLFS